MLVRGIAQRTPQLQIARLAYRKQALLLKNAYIDSNHLHCHWQYSKFGL